MHTSICPYKAFDIPVYTDMKMSALLRNLMSRSYLYTTSHTGICKRIGTYVHIKPSIHLYIEMKMYPYMRSDSKVCSCYLLTYAFMYVAMIGEYSTRRHELTRLHILSYVDIL